MPIYEYRCLTCGERFEKLFLSINLMPAKTACPACQSREVQRLVSAPVVRAGGKNGEDKESEDTTPPKPPVFGRKELNEALKNRGY